MRISQLNLALENNISYGNVKIRFEALLGKHFLVKQVYYFMSLIYCWTI